MSLGLRSNASRSHFDLGISLMQSKPPKALVDWRQWHPQSFQDLPGPSRSPDSPFPFGGLSAHSTRQLVRDLAKKHLSCSRHWRFPEVSQKVLKCFEIRIVFPFFLCFFLCFFDLMQAVHPTHLTSFDKTVTVPRLHPASRIFIGLLLPERCVASTHGIANAVFATRWFGWDECDEYEHTYIHNYTHMYIYNYIYIICIYIYNLNDVFLWSRFVLKFIFPCLRLLSQKALASWMSVWRAWSTLPAHSPDQPKTQKLMKLSLCHCAEVLWSFVHLSTM